MFMLFSDCYLNSKYVVYIVNIIFVVLSLFTLFQYNKLKKNANIFTTNMLMCWLRYTTLNDRAIYYAAVILIFSSYIYQKIIKYLVILLAS